MTDGQLAGRHQAPDVVGQAAEGEPPLDQVGRLAGDLGDFLNTTAELGHVIVVGVGFLNGV